ncbi:MAG: hypothetical protein OXC62_04245 [Aestuariivita sp.]|nr:hypothetical protein [Aestuariivita sp.]
MPPHHQRIRIHIMGAHVNLLGEYDFPDEKLQNSIRILPLKSTV